MKKEDKQDKPDFTGCASFDQSISAWNTEGSSDFDIDCKQPDDCHLKTPGKTCNCLLKSQTDQLNGN